MRLDHAAIGNGRVLALVSPTSSIDWLCLPRFDSPSVFARLLDEQDGGWFRVLSGGSVVRGQLGYVRNTNVVRGEFRDGDNAWEITDFAPRIPEGLTVRCPIEIVRVVRPLAGRPQLRVDFEPRPDYGRARPALTETATGVDVVGAGALHLATNLPAAYVLGKRPFTLDQPYYFALSAESRPEPMGLEPVLHALNLTVAGWRQWAKTCALPPYAPERVLRSALCLKLHASEDTGAIIAAATTSIPEALGTQRTWDYRYCWMRDAAFVVEALRRLGHLEEGERFLRFLRNVVEAGPIQPLYAIDGARQLDEVALPHLRGFRGNGFVRVGNAAYAQQQNDLMGEMILCLDAMLRDPRIVHDDADGYFPLIRRLVEQAIELADEPDTGIWEFRSLLRPYTFSRAMCWAALERGARLATRFGEPALASAWASRAAAERATVLTRGYNGELGFFTQALDGAFPDASILLLPTIGLVDAGDSRFTSTLDVYAARLVERGLMLRYRNEDDFGVTTSAFTICSFWWATALAQAGRLDDAIAVFERITGHANPVGLFSEDIDPSTGELLGNFPQAYTHVGLIHAAATIAERIAANSGYARGWVA
jgi:GH15 family glucan-1,4-alpha-glucosidase